MAETLEASRAHAVCFKNKEDCFTVTILKFFKMKQTALPLTLPGLSSLLHEEALKVAPFDHSFYRLHLNKRK